MAFTLTELAVDAGVLALCPLPQADDVAVLAQWRADLVLTLVEPEELATLSPALAGALQTAGIAQLHFPIADYGVPAADWSALSADLRSRLARGARVVVHCRGGCGRTGMIALRLMVETGEDADTALARLRAVRPCAIETAAQMDWARGAGVT